MLTISLSNFHIINTSLSTQSTQTSIAKNNHLSLSEHSRPVQASSMAISKPTQPKSLARSLQPSALRSRQTISWSQSMPSVPASSRREVRLWKECQ